MLHESMLPDAYFNFSLFIVNYRNTLDFYILHLLIQPVFIFKSLLYARLL